MAQRISVLVNSAAGGNRGLARTKTLVAELADRGWTVDLLKATRAENVAAAITEAKLQGMERLILAGGDGLIHHALPALVDSSVVFGIVPVGTGNDFCRGLDLPTNRRSAIDHAIGSGVMAVDALRVEADADVRYGATVLTAGFSGRVNARANEMTRRGLLKGASRYSLATLAELATLEPAGFRMQFDDGHTTEIEACLIAVGNTRYFGGGMAVCPDARFDDGAMDVVIINPVSKATFARVLPLVFSGRYVRHPQVIQRRCRHLAISTGETFWADGETLGIGGRDQVSGIGGRDQVSTISIAAGALSVARLDEGD